MAATRDRLKPDAQKRQANADPGKPSRGSLRLRRKVHRVASLLHSAYGSPHHDNKDDPLDELVFIVLSQMTTQPSFGRVFQRLRTRIGRWDRLLDMSLPTIRRIIRDAGLSNQKAPRLRAIVRRLLADFGRVSLARLRQANNRIAEQYLTSLPGVGVKTAKCVMMYSMGRRVLPVDTHTLRVSRRLGLIDLDLPLSRAQVEIEAAVLPADRYRYHVNCVAHGRLTCLPRNPRCDRCVLVRICKHGKGRFPETPGHRRKRATLSSKRP